MLLLLTAVASIVPAANGSAAVPFSETPFHSQLELVRYKYLPRFCRGSRPAAVRLPELNSCPPKAVGPPKSPVSELRLNAGSGLPKRCAVARASDRAIAKQTANCGIEDEEGDGH